MMMLQTQQRFRIPNPETEIMKQMLASASRLLVVSNRKLKKENRQNLTPLEPRHILHSFQKFERLLPSL